MKRCTAALILALSACAPAPTRGDAERLRAQELGVVMALSVQETSQLHPGQWVLYTVRAKGSPTPISSRLAVVGSDGGRFWIENRTDQESQRFISKIQIDRDGKVLQYWVGELGTSQPKRVYPGLDAAGRPIEPPSTPAADAQAKVEVAKERITLAMTGKPYECTRLTSKATYPDGRQTELVTWCSPEIPFPVVYQGKSYGGVVRRTYGRYTMEITASGTDATAELVLPDK